MKTRSARRLRMTRQRRVILEELNKVRSHPTAYEIYEKVRERLPRISLGTVYRNLEQLSESGAVQKLELAGAQRRFDGDTSNHYHVRCIQCGRVDDITVDPIPALENAVRETGKYEIVGYRLQFLGVCPRCRSARRVSTGENRQGLRRSAKCQQKGRHSHD